MIATAYTHAVAIVNNTDTKHSNINDKMRHFILCAIAVLTAIPAVAQMKIQLGKDSPLRKLQIAELAIENLYVDTVNANKLVEDGIRGMLSKLDPHSSYSTAEETKELNEPLQGNFEGIGVQYNMVEDTLLVIQTVNGGPSEKVGILAGDRIIAVNDTAIAGVKMSRSEIMRRLRGKKGTKVNVAVKRAGEAKPIVFTVTRDRIPVTSLDAAYLIEPGIGYVKLGSFGATTFREMVHAIDSLRQRNSALSPSRKFNLILDLQDNGGGYLSAAVEVANEFLAEDDLIVYTEGRKVPRRDMNANGYGKTQKGHIVVLVNEYTASAAEIVSGAIQDHDRGYIVGRRTFGKGLVQRPVELPDGSMIRLTVAHYYTPTGRCIQKPYKPGDKAGYDMDFEQRLKHGELTCRDSIHFADSLKFSTLKKQRTVYGGGGIMPDVFVPLDTTQYTRYHRMLVAKGIIVAQTLKYFDLHRKEMAKYNDIKHFCSDFIVPDELIKIVMKEGEKQDIKPKDEEERNRTMPYLKMQLKALMARDLFNQSAYLEVANPYSDIYNKGVEVMKTLIKENKYDKVQ